MREIKPNRRIMLVKELKSLYVVVGLDIEVSMQHKYTGEYNTFSVHQREEVEDDDKRGLLNELERDMKKRNPEGFKAEQLKEEFYKSLKKAFDEELKTKLEKINESVYNSFRNGKNAILELGKKKINVSSYCTFEVIKSKSFVFCGNKEDYKEWDF